MFGNVNGNTNRTDYVETPFNQRTGREQKNELEAEIRHLKEQLKHKQKLLHGKSSKQKTLRVKLREEIKVLEEQIETTQWHLARLEKDLEFDRNLDEVGLFGPSTLGQAISVVAQAVAVPVTMGLELAARHPYIALGMILGSQIVGVGAAPLVAAEDVRVTAERMGENSTTTESSPIPDSTITRLNTPSHSKNVTVTEQTTTQNSTILTHSATTPNTSPTTPKPACQNTTLSFSTTENTGTPTSNITRTPTTAVPTKPMVNTTPDSSTASTPTLPPKTNHPFKPDDYQKTVTEDKNEKVTRCDFQNHEGEKESRNYTIHKNQQYGPQQSKHVCKYDLRGKLDMEHDPVGCREVADEHCEELLLRLNQPGREELCEERNLTHIFDTRTDPKVEKDYRKILGDICDLPPATDPPPASKLSETTKEVLITAGAVAAGVAGLGAAIYCAKKCCANREGSDGYFPIDDDEVLLDVTGRDNFGYEDDSEDDELWEPAVGSTSGQAQIIFVDDDSSSQSSTSSSSALLDGNSRKDPKSRPVLRF